jgi:lysozyme
MDGILQISPDAAALIKKFEGFYNKAYLCPAGVPTIGWGTVVYPDGTKVKIGDVCTVVQANDYLLYEVQEKAKEVAHLLHGVTFTQHQFDALVSFAYNLGVHALKESTLLKKALVNPNDTTIYKYEQDKQGMAIANSCEFLRWVKAGGKTYRGLILRRTAEADLYKKV